MGGVLQGVGSSVVRAKFGIKVSQDSDADRVAHASIVLDEDGHFVGCGSGQVRSVVRLLLQREAAHRTPAACGEGHDSYQDCRMSDVVNATEAVLGLAAARTPSAGK